MENEMWEKCQEFVNAGLGEMVKHLYEKELTDNLTEEQLAKLGSISDSLDKMMAAKSNMKNLIHGLIYLSKENAIRGPRA